MSKLCNKLYTALILSPFLLTMLASAAEDTSSIKNSFERLIQGNKRYVTSNTICHEDWTAKRAAKSQGQAPFAVNATKGQSGDLLEKTIKANVINVEEKLKNSKPVLANLLSTGAVRIIGAYYDLESGNVDFLDVP